MLEEALLAAPHLGDIGLTAQIVRQMLLHPPKLLASIRSHFAASRAYHQPLRIESHPSGHQVVVLADGGQQHTQYEGHTRKLHEEQAPLPRTLVIGIAAEHLRHRDAGKQLAGQHTCQQKQHCHNGGRHPQRLPGEEGRQIGNAQQVADEVGKQIHQQHGQQDGSPHQQPRLP